MVTHARDIVDKMNKRVVAIDHGRIVRDEEGGYAYKQSNNDDLYIPGFTSYVENPIKAATMQLDPDLVEIIQGKAADIPAKPEPEVDSFLDAYLDGGEDVYE